MELLQLRYFQSIARFRSVSEAARFYGIPQSAMSQSLKRLENDLGGIRLFDRVNQRIVLNEKGRMFLQRVDEVLAILDSAVREARDTPDEIAGAVHLLVTENTRFVVQCVSQFKQIYPDVSFYICHDYYSNQEAEYDLCISASSYDHQMKASAPLIRERMVLAVCDSHPLAQRQSVSLAELKDEKFIVSTERSSLYRLTVESCRAFGFEPRISISCDDPYFIRKYISTNMGVVIAPSLSWEGRFRENTRLIEIVDPPLYSTSYIYWNDRVYHSPTVTAFREYLREEARKVRGNLLGKENHNSQFIIHNE